MRYTALANGSNEVWEDIAGYEGYYKVSNHGRIKSYRYFPTTNTQRDKIIATVVGKTTGYVMVNLKVKGVNRRYSVHRIVLSAFVKNEANLPCVNHKDGNKENNNLCNLEWTDKKGNMVHAMEMLGIKRFGENNPNSKYSDDIVLELRKMHESGVSVYRCAKVLNINQSSAYAIINNTFRKTV